MASVFLPLQYYFSSKTLTTIKPSYKFPPKFSTIPSSSFSSSSSYASSSSQPLKKSHKSNSIQKETSNTTQNQRLKRDLLKKLREKDSDPIQILKDDGDWTQELFWVVVTFLQQSSRSMEILQVFEIWKTLDISRSNTFNYENIVGLLAEEGLTENIVRVIRDMKSNNIGPLSKTYHALIYCFIQKGMLKEASAYINEMQEMNLKPTRELYHELIKAYANHKMYDEMNQCMKKMEKAGCAPDLITYNLFIQEFSRAGLLKRMERTFQIVLMKKMSLQSSTRIAMLEAYANFGMIKEMERVYWRVMNLRKVILTDDLIRKIAGVYIENHMFSRLDDLGIDLSKKSGTTDMVWCLRMLSQACLSSQKGIDSIIREMRSQGDSWTVTIVNIMLLAYLKMKDLNRMKLIISDMPFRFVKPDIVTFGILFDASRLGFDMSEELSTWSRLGLVNEAVEINTDPLVFTAFGKGEFLQACETKFSSSESISPKKKNWTYEHLIEEVIKHYTAHVKVNGVY